MKKYSFFHQKTRTCQHSFIITTNIFELICSDHSQYRFSAFCFVVAMILSLFNYGTFIGHVSLLKLMDFKTFHKQILVSERYCIGCFSFCFSFPLKQKENLFLFISFLNRRKQSIRKIFTCSLHCRIKYMVLNCGLSLLFVSKYFK